MRWQQWVLVVLFALSVLRLYYYADRPRPVTGLGHALVGTVEFGFYIWLVVSL